MRFLGLVVTWVVGLALLGGVLSGAYYLRHTLRPPNANENEKFDVPKRAENGVVKLGQKLADSHGIKDEAALATSWQPRLTVYGRVAPNPQATAEVRSPYAGTLRTHPSTAWPWPGQSVRAGQVFGRIDIRIGPQERLDLQAKLSEARLRMQGAEDVLKVQEDRVERLRKFGTNSDIVSRRELDEAVVQLTEARTARTTAKAAVELWQKALATIEKPGDRPVSTWSESLTIPSDGEITELAARPDTAIESGGLVVRVVDFRRPLVRLDLPPEALRSELPERIELMAASGSTPGESQRVQAYLVGPAPQVDVASQYASYLYEVRPLVSSATGASNGGVIWRPGLFVKAQVALAGDKPKETVAVPRSALLYHQGRALVYVRIGPGRYERREVHILGDNAGQVVLADGVMAGESVVYRQAQVLLSEEFRGDVDND